MTTLDQAAEQMRAAGMPDFPAGHPKLNTARIVRYGPKSRAWYRLYEWVSDRNGRSYISGAYGIWGWSESQKIQTDTAGLDEADRDRMQRELAAAREREDAKRVARADFAAKRAKSQWSAGARDGPWPYLERKGVTPEAVRSWADGTLLIPMLRYGADVDVRPELVGLQKVSADGTKRFTKNMAKEGTLLLLGGVDPTAGADAVIAIAEGYATARTIRQAVRALPVAVVFDAGNIAPAARALRARFPEARLLVCADDDWKTEIPKGTPCNVGVTKARALVESMPNVSMCVPLFPAATREDRWTDFNDLQAALGLEAVVEQLVDAIGAARDDPDRDAPQAGPAARPKLRLVSSDEAPAKKTKKPKAPVDWSTLRMMLERYTLLYGTKTAWDGLTRRIIALDALAAAYPFYFRVWKESAERKMIDQERVVFDPSDEKREPDWINLFNGWPIEPAAGECRTIGKLLRHLCNGDGTVLAWLLRWLALPLQRPGSKMATAVIMHGDEGSGKNLFLSVMQAIYGEYSMMIGQEQIESRYNEWASKRLFVIANEVLTRQEMRTHKGRLKFYITEPQIPIEGKFMPVRVEQNCMNIVFLSNETQPLLLDPGDRRYLVLWTPPPLERDFYSAVADEIAAGGAAAFYAYLMAVPLEGFGPHSKPPETEAKRDLIDLAKPSPLNFYTEWCGGMTPFPFITCRSLDLYHAYDLWCKRFGERNPWSVHKFSREVKRHLPAPVKRIRLPDADSDEQYTLFVVPPPGDPPSPADDGVSEKYALGRSCEAFKASFERCSGGAWVVQAPGDRSPTIEELDDVPL